MYQTTSLRVNVDSVSVEIDETQLKIKVQWSLKEDSSVSSTTEVNYDKIA